MTKRTKKPRSQAKPPIPPDEVLNELSEAIRRHADFLDECRRECIESGASDVRVLPTNFYGWLSKMRETFSTQVTNKFLKSKLVKNPNARFAPLVARLGELDEIYDHKKR